MSLLAPPGAGTDAAAVLEVLNPAQRAAAEVVRGPLCILAGAGTGKTTTVTHRIAWQVHSGTFDARDILALTFTRKAAEELRSRLARLAVHGVEARTFHATAAWMLRFLWPEYESGPLPSLLQSKYTLIAPLARQLPKPYCFRPVRDLVSALEWGANRRILPESVGESMEAAGIEPPLPPDLIMRLAGQYAHAKASHGCIDFEDLLRSCVEMLDRHPAALDRIRSRFRAFTVDEYQDVNPLQHDLLDRWLGDRDDLCVVGDDYQTIYSFTGARSSYLTGFASRFADAEVVRLEENYRSTPQVIAVASAIAEHLPGHVKRLLPTRPEGLEPEVAALTDAEAQGHAIAERASAAITAGTPPRQIGVLYRTNAQSATYEQALAGRGIPAFVRGRGLLQRDAWQQLQRALPAQPAEVPTGERARAAAAAIGWAPGAKVQAGSEEETRQRDLSLLVDLARQLGPADSLEVAVQERFGHENDENGVQLMSIHSAKGLEFDLVFLPELDEGVLPYGRGKRRPPLDEERRLFFVAVTRAREGLWLGWSTGAKKGPSRFLAEAGLVAPSATPKSSQRTGRSPRKQDIAESLDPADRELYEALRRWRKVAADDRPAYVVFTNRTLADIARARPSDVDELIACKGVGEDRLARFGADVLRIVGEHA